MGWLDFLACKLLVQMYLMPTRNKWLIKLIFYDGGLYHIEISPLVFSTNQWTDFYMVGTSVIKKVNLL